MKVKENSSTFLLRVKCHGGGSGPTIAISQGQWASRAEGTKQTKILHRSRVKTKKHHTGSFWQRWSSVAFLSQLYDFRLTTHMPLDILGNLFYEQLIFSHKTIRLPCLRGQGTFLTLYIIIHIIQIINISYYNILYILYLL